MMSPTQARELAVVLAAKAIEGGPDAWLTGSMDLESLDGRSWLALDQAARTSTYPADAPVSGVRGWLSTTMGEPTGFVAAVTSLHVDGRFRERATRVLATCPTGIAASALAVRSLDHVPQVREAAWMSLRSHLDPDTAPFVLDVILAGRNRQHAVQALDDIRHILIADFGSEEIMRSLLARGRRSVRRWAFEFGHERGLLTADQLVDAARNDPDQWLRATCADWLMTDGGPSHLAELLDTNSVEARLVALTRVPDSDLSDEVLRHLLTDRAPRVREQARWRAGLRGLDVISHYRDQLASSSIPPRVRAACLDGIAGVGDESDLPTCVEHLGHHKARVRAAAVNAVSVRARDEDVRKLLVPALLDASPRVSATASRSLARLGAPPSTAAEAWASERPASRRAAWQVSRASGSWHRVEADLQAAGDPDAGLASLGHAGVSSWLSVSAATTWDRPSDEQRTRIADLLEKAGLDAEQARIVAFHAGVERPAATVTGTPDPSAPRIASLRRWLRVIRRR